MSCSIPTTAQPEAGTTALPSWSAGAISIQVLQEFYVNATRKIAKPLDHEVALSRVRVLSRWTVHIPHPPDVVAAAELAEASRLSFWDAMIVHSASALDCAVVWSEDLSDGQEIAGEKVRNPFRS